MHLKSLAMSFVIATAIVFNLFSTSTPLVAIVTQKEVVQFCEEISTIYNCTVPESMEVLNNRSSHISFSKSVSPTSPELSVFSNQGYLSIGFKDGTTIPNVTHFLMMDHKTEVDVYLMNTTASYVFTCESDQSKLQLSSNILNVADIEDPDKVMFAFIGWYPIFRTEYTVVVPGRKLLSGYFKCTSTDEHSDLETIRVFPGPRYKAATVNTEVPPFLSVRQSPIHVDDTGYGFIVPCTTLYKPTTPPNLLWKKTQQDTFSMLTQDELQSFRWDPDLGYYFNSTERLWEIETLACQLGTYKATFLPTPSRFSNLYLVFVEQKKMSCQQSKRHNVKNPILSSNLSLLSTRFHPCFSEIDCQLYWDTGFLHKIGRNFSIDENEETPWYLKIGRGIVSCYFEHVYSDKHIPEISYSKFFFGLDSNLYLLPGLYPSSSVVQISQVNYPFYKGLRELHHEFTCTIVPFVMSNMDLVNLTLRHENNTETIFKQKFEYGRSTSCTIKFNVTLQTSITHATCYILTVQGNIMSAGIPLNVLEASAPQVEDMESEITLKVGDLIDDQKLYCPITGAPPPEYKWFIDAKSASLVKEVNTRNLSFRQIHEDIAGTYMCEAWNEFGNNSFLFHVHVLPRGLLRLFSRKSIICIAFAATLIFFGLFAAIVVLIIKYFRAKVEMRNLTPKEVQEFLNGIHVPRRVFCDKGSGEGCGIAIHLPFTKRIDPKSLTIARDSILGTGQFGIVFQGALNSEIVAVKAFKRAVTYEEFSAILVEVKVMDFVGEHPNIVRFIGADVTNIERRQILIAMELSPVGNLEKHLRTLKPPTKPNYVNRTQYTTLEKLTLMKLFSFIEQIAFAMEHLASKKVIHGDLAARNVLIFHHGVAKVTDFGFSRQLYETETYKPKNKCSIPWRSASIELLRHMEFSIESDIWAFGVTIWEIFSFGEVPFADMGYNDHLAESLENGLRLQKPAIMSEFHYSFVKECWNSDKSRRPRFSVLKDFFAMERLG